MKIEHHGWDSPHTGARMQLVRFGDRGVPFLYLPTSGGDHREFERYGMHHVCAPLIDAGRIQVLTIDAGGPMSLFNPALAPLQRIERYVRYENYVAEEVLPWIVRQCDTAPILVGASYGAYIGANLLFRHPEAVPLVCGLGGVYGMWHCLDGHHDDAVYFHTPLEYVPRLTDEALLGKIRATRGIVMFAAEDDEWLPSTYQLARVLSERKLPFELDVWRSPANHHEHWWKLQLKKFLRRYS